MKVKDEQTLLTEICNLLEERLPKPRRFWKRPSVYIFLALFLSLFFFDFSFGKRGDCDFVVTEGTEINIVKMPEPDWEKQGIEFMENSEYWQVSEPTSGQLVFFKILIKRQGFTYKESGIRAIKRKDGTKVDLLTPPVIVHCPSIFIVEPVGESLEDKLIRNQIIRTYAIKMGKSEIPLSAFIDHNTGEGKLLIDVKPRVGLRRFKANLSMAWGLLTLA